MIEGLKICIPANDLRDLLLASAAYHSERVAAYRTQVDNLKQAQVEGMNYTNGNPVETLTERMDEHEDAEAEMTFLAKYLREGEEYLLDREEVAELGTAGKRRSRRGRRGW
jgi:hypothetical protein